MLKSPTSAGKPLPRRGVGQLPIAETSQTKGQPIGVHPASRRRPPRRTDSRRRSRNSRADRPCAPESTGCRRLRTRARAGASRNTTRSSGPRRNRGAASDTSNARGVTALGSVTTPPPAGSRPARPRRQPHPAGPVSRRQRFRGGMQRHRAERRTHPARASSTRRCATPRRCEGRSSNPLGSGQSAAWTTRRRRSPAIRPCPSDLGHAAVEHRFPDGQDLQMQLFERCHPNVITPRGEVAAALRQRRTTRGRRQSRPSASMSWRTNRASSNSARSGRR